MLAAATYEMGAIAWGECCNAPAGATKASRLQKATECEAYLNTVAAWEAFLLDARIGMRVQSGLETLSWFKQKMTRIDLDA